MFMWTQQQMQHSVVLALSLYLIFWQNRAAHSGMFHPKVSQHALAHKAFPDMTQVQAQPVSADTGYDTA